MSGIPGCKITGLLVLFLSTISIIRSDKETDREKLTNRASSNILKVAEIYKNVHTGFDMKGLNKG